MTAVVVEPGIRIAHYTLREVIGEGASSVVYLAEHRATGRLVAIKTLRPSLAADDDTRARLRLECRVLGRVHNAHLVEALDAGTRNDGSPYLVLERLDGASLSAHVAHGPLPIAAAIAVAVAVLDALEELHVAGFVHRDVKPGNVVLHRERGSVVPKLVDLGVCLDMRVDAAPRRTQTGSWVGTPCYMAPEQLAGRSVDTRTDVYGVGAMLYECLTGAPPHDGRTAAEVAARALWDPVVPVGLRRDDCPRELEAVVMRSLAKRPGDRPSSAGDMLNELVAMRDMLELPSGPAALAELVDPRTLPIPLRRRAISEQPTALEGSGALAVNAPRRRHLIPVAMTAGLILLGLCAAVYAGAPSAHAPRLAHHARAVPAPVRASLPPVPASVPPLLMLDGGAGSDASMESAWTIDELVAAPVLEVSPPAHTRRISPQLPPPPPPPEDVFEPVHVWADEVDAGESPSTEPVVLEDPWARPDAAQTMQ